MLNGCHDDQVVCVPDGVEQAVTKGEQAFATGL